MSALKQGTEEWLEMRRKYIGASDAPAVMQVSPWKTPYQLWMEKVTTNVPTKKSAAMQRGNDLEEPARQCFEKKTGLVVFPKVKFHAEISFMMASLDGMDIEEENIVEIKCPNAIDHAMAVNGKVPEKYIPQLMHQMEVCQLEKAFYFSFDGNDGVIVTVERDDSYIKNLIKQEEIFWDYVQNFTAPPMIDKDFKVKNDYDWIRTAQKWKSVKDNINHLMKEETSLRESLISMSDNQNCLGGGIALKKMARKGAVDYKMIPELQDKNLDIYRKGNIEYWQIEGC